MARWILGGRKNFALEHHQQALAALEKVLELGDVDADYLEADPWFADPRRDRRFLPILDEMKRRREKSPRS